MIERDTETSIEGESKKTEEGDNPLDLFWQIKVNQFREDQ